MANNKNPQNKRVTIKSIAEEMGISFSTISKALNNNECIKEETRRAVLDKAYEMGYSPNMLARGLKNKQTKTIGVIFNDVENTVLTHIFKTISIEMAKYGHMTFICDAQFDEKIEQASILSLLSRMPDFLILSPTTANRDNICLCRDIWNRVILLGDRIPGINCHYVHVDYELGGYLSACELLSKGHRNNLIITEPLSFPISNQYVQGIRRAYGEYGLSLEEGRIKYAHASLDNGFSTMMDLWDNTKGAFKFPITGVLIFCDSMAHGVYKALERVGKKIPEDISVIGHDDNPLSGFSMPPLSTVHLPKEKMAESCISIMKSILVEGKQDLSYYSLAPYFISRKSVGPAPGERKS
jgi:LacI family transcriptional regulator